MAEGSPSWIPAGNAESDGKEHGNDTQTLVPSKGL